MSKYFPKSINELLIEAYQVQDACNLSGVVHSFSNAITDLRANGIKDTAAINSHPVSVMYASKIASLTRQRDFKTERDAMNKGHEAYFSANR